MTKRREPSRAPADNDAAAAKRYKEHLDNKLDEALRETFPASDPIAVTPRRKRRPAQRKQGVAEQRRS